MSRILLETACKILFSAGVTEKFVANVLNVACYLMNRFPLNMIRYQTLEEVWLGKIADYSILSIFGSYAMIQQVIASSVGGQECEQAYRL